jgi:superfamily I DNA/RNA helicase
MLTMIIDHNIPLTKYDLVAVDESQDLNQIQIEIVARLMKSDGRIITIGDPNQSMYRFRGADSTAMDKLAHKFNITEHLPLSITYRCAKSIVAKAQGYVPKIQAAETAPEGQVIDATWKQLDATMLSLKPGAMVVCRANAPLVAQALTLIRAKRKVIVRGTDIGKGIKKIFDDAVIATRSQNLKQLLANLSDYQAKRMDKLIAQEKEAQANAFQDKMDTLRVILEDCDTFEDVDHCCATLFSDIQPENAITFSSIHKSKGLEAETVCWLYPQINDYFLGRSSNQEVIQQEQNIIYVAITRAKTTLIIQEQKPRNQE